ncbi:MAG TPA: SGNH/GDSL hydrolase family protein [Candidatus Acidoferrum sp.]|nr:SGNH/GDSL hydrolase family protein [Candidatus Acidoferrum sp.]
MMTRYFLLVLLFAAANTFGQPKTNSFEGEIRKFEASDKTNPPPKNAVLFLGSSSIRMWRNVAKDFPDYRVINRGFGGSQIADSIYFAERIIFPYEPSTIVFYAGGNDINAGKSAEKVFSDFQTLVTHVHSKLPKTQIAYISVAPNPARWSQIERIRRANELIAGYTRTDPRLSFINTYEHMLGADGAPKPGIFLPDRLHMNTNGYAIWKEVVGEHLKRIAPDAAKK